MDEYKKELVDIGLSENEVAVYLAALAIGKGSIQEISRKAKVKRVTTYGVMDNLMKYGLASSVTKGKRQYFIAENPERVLDYVEQKKKDFLEKEKEVKGVIPKLKEMHQSSGSEGPTVKYYTGKDGVISMVKDLLDVKENEDIWMAYPADLVKQLLSEEERKKINFKELNKVVKIKTLYTSNEPMPSTKISRRIQLPTNEFPLDADIAVYGNNIRMATLKGEVVGIVIENKDIADTMKTILKLAWIGSKNIHK